ncbi:hypothetical protein LY78DRAFT_439985 [Colletotrichum sublineola]|nr:hypothetical protein LY78DRAFT_439985 [Colletotrichum sublineola]
MACSLQPPPPLPPPPPPPPILPLRHPRSRKKIEIRLDLEFGYLHSTPHSASMRPRRPGVVLVPYPNDETSHWVQGPKL